MVFLAFPAGLVGDDDTERGIALLYLVTLSLITLATYAMDSYAHRHEEMVLDDSMKPDRMPLLFAGFLVALGLLSLVLELVFDVAGQWALLGIFLIPITRRIVQRQTQTPG